MTAPLTRQAVLEVAQRVERLEPRTPVVIDLTAIPSFDSDGAEALTTLQQVRRDGPVSIVGFRQAAARLVGHTPDDEPVAPATDPAPDWVLRRLRNLAVLQPADPANPRAEALEDALTQLGDVEAAILVIDLRGVPLLPGGAVESIGFASSSAALRGQELLVVNVSPATAEALRTVGLSATTYVAPEPPLGSASA